jgi:peptide/histidine transporter 3/4
MSSESTKLLLMDHNHRTKCYKPAYRIGWLRNKGAVLIALWSFLVSHVFYFLRDGRDEKRSEDPLNASASGVILLISILLFPLYGWIADRRLGRYRTVRYGMWIMWISAMVATLGESLGHLSVTYDASIKVWVFRGLCIVMIIGFGVFQSNITQLGIDQLIDASASEITSFILWYVWTFYMSGLCLRYISDCVASEYNMFYIKTLVVAVCLTIALCLDFLCHHWLVKEEIIGQSLRETMKIVKYVVKNRRRRYDFADEDYLPSRFEIAKHQYGGPFAAQKVDNVRTFLWILAILAACGIVFGAIMPIEFAREKLQHRWDGFNEASGLIGCYNKLSIRFNDYFIVVTSVALYELLVYPFFHICLPKGSIVNMLLMGTVLFIFWILSLLSIEAIALHKQLSLSLNNASSQCIFNNDNPQVMINRKVLLIPDIVGGPTCIILVITALEFIWAQTPSAMKGLTFGAGYAILGLNTLLQTIVALPFLFKLGSESIYWRPLSCGIWYFITEFVIIFTVLAVLSVIFKKYKKRSDDQVTLSVYAY